MEFSNEDSQSYKILYQVVKMCIKKLKKKTKEFLAAENFQNLSVTYDNYTSNEVFIILQGIKSKQYANDIALILKDNKEFKIVEPAIIISNENYKVIQIKKNLSDYLALKPCLINKKALHRFTR
jgi:hypothetical protein